ncbi:MAG: hypothetical protein HY070_11805, partial [Chloroflexi bacterium]|nr:hypothetical protein [Chloroflexota bacterium]
MLTRFFSGSISFRRDDAIKIILLFVIHLLYFVGLRWIDNASYSLFLENWGAAELSSMFVASAVLIVIFGAVYGFLAARISHEKLLTVLALGIIAWLASVEILQRTPGFAGQRGIVYPYFFLLTGVLGDIGAAHILIYLSEFYDTRAAKRALPVLVSASIAGAIIAGALAPTLKTKLGLDNLPLATIACLLLILVCVYALRILVPQEIELAEQRVRSALVNWQKNPARGNLRFLRELGIVRWLVLSTFVLVVLMKLLTFQSGLIFEAEYKGNPGALFDFYSAIDVYASIAGLIFSSLIFGPMIVRFGIGKMNMLFPLITLGAIGALNLSPNLSTAVLGRVNDRVLKKVFRNPLDAMLLNSVPTRVKARARNFVNGASNSLGTLATGLLTLAIAARDLTPNQVIGVSLLLAVVYIFSAWRLRAEYSRA